MAKKISYMFTPPVSLHFQSAADTILIQKLKDLPTRVWYAEKALEL